MRTIPLLLLSLLCTCVSAQKMAVEPRLEKLGQSLSKATGDSARQSVLLDSLRLVSEELGTPLGHAYYVEQRVAAGKVRMDTTEAKRLLAEAMSVYEAAGDELGRARIFGHLGYLAYRKRDNLLVYQMAEEQLVASRKADNDHQIGVALGNLGLSSKLAGNFKQAKRYYLESIDHAMATRDTMSAVKSLHNLGNLHQGKDPMQIDSALMYGASASELLMSFNPNDHDMLGMRFQADAMANARRKNFTVARELAQRSYENYRLSGNARSIYRSMYYLGRIERKVGNAKRAGELLFAARDLLPSVPNVDPTWLYSEIGHYYKDRGQADSTAKYLQLHGGTIREQTKKRQSSKIAALETQFRTSQQRAEIERLALEDELSQARIARQRWVIGGGVVLLLGLAGLLYFLLRQRRRIRAQNQTIQTALAEKDTLLKEIHHRVKNNLQMVSSLLSLQSDYISDDVAIDALKMGQSRVRSMAIIHQKLYMRDQVRTDVSARDYLDQLIGELLATLNVTGLPLHLTKNLEDIQLDIDRMIPLGLIANEVITNALKYAFTGRDEGTLNVSFTKQASQIELLIEDDGRGLFEGFASREDSFGTLLMRTLAEQLEGELRVSGVEGTQVRLRFPE